MRNSKTFGAAILALAAIANGCALLTCEPADFGGVHLVGIAGAG